MDHCVMITDHCVNCKYNTVSGLDEPCSRCIYNGGNEDCFEFKLDPIKPEYYNDTKITPFDVIDDWELNFYLGNAIKYIKRAGKKADNSKLQDLKKVREYIEHEIKVEEANNENK